MYSPHSAISGRLSCSSSGDRRVPNLRKSSMVWIWQYDKRTDNKIILNCIRKLMKTKITKRVHKLHTKNGLPPSLLSGGLNCSSSGDRRVPHLRKSSKVQVWQHDKRTEKIV
jgi:hypothetical protein